MEDVDIQPVEQVQVHREILTAVTPLGGVKIPVVQEEEQLVQDDQQKIVKKRPGRPRIHPFREKTGEKHIMTQARLDALSRARGIRMDKIKARKVLEEADQVEGERLKELGRLVVNNTRLAELEQSNNLAIDIGQVDGKLGELKHPITNLSDFKNSHKPIATIPEEMRRADPFQPVRTVVFQENGGSTQKVFQKDLTFSL